MITDCIGLEVKIGDKVRGEGTLDFNGNYKIDLTPVVTVTEKNGTIFFGGLSMTSFRRFWKITSEYKPKLRF